MTFLGASLLVASPAVASGGIAVPEPENIGLFALAVIGLIIGRSASRRPPHDDHNDA